MKKGSRRIYEDDQSPANQYRYMLASVSALPNQQQNYLSTTNPNVQYYYKILRPISDSDSQESSDYIQNDDYNLNWWQRQPPDPPQPQVVFANQPSKKRHRVKKRRIYPTGLEELPLEDPDNVLQEGNPQPICIVRHSIDNSNTPIIYSHQNGSVERIIQKTQPKNNSKQKSQNGNNSGQQHRKKKVKTNQHDVPNQQGQHKKKKKKAADNKNVSNHQNQEPKKKTKEEKENSKTDKETENTSEDSIFISEESQDNLPLINYDRPYFPVFAIGIQVILVLCIIGSFFQAGKHFMSIKINPLFGPNDITLASLGAKYGPFISDGEFWRLFTAIFIQPGVIYFILCIALGILTIKVEYETGFFRTSFIFVFGGMFGYIISCLFLPTIVSCGASGAFLSLVGVMLVDVIISWSYEKHRVMFLILIIVAIVISIILGLTPYIDNFTHLAGLISGVLFGLSLTPSLSFSRCQRIVQGIIAFIAFPLMSTLFMLCLIIFYRTVDADKSWCSVCEKMNCIDISNWCHSSM